MDESTRRMVARYLDDQIKYVAASLAAHESAVADRYRFYAEASARMVPARKAMLDELRQQRSLIDQEGKANEKA